MLKTFDEVFDDYTKYGTKIKTEQYETIGTNIIIDQGQSDIAGYTDQSEGLFTDVPVIVFGDHTRIIKYINRPFFLGADGTKILKSKIPDANYKYLYYALKNAKIPNTGYNRHFKWLKQISISYPEHEKQSMIVEILDKLEDSIDNYNTILGLLDKLVKARFIEMFGEPVNNDKVWVKDSVERLCREIYGGGTPSKSHPEYYEGGKIPWITSKDMKTDILIDSQIHINEDGVANSTARIVPKNSVIMVIRSGILKHTLPVAINAVPVTVNQDLKVFVAGNRIVTKFLAYQFKMMERDILSGVRAVTADNIEFDALKRRELIVPPIELQQEFADFVEQVDKSRFIELLQDHGVFDLGLNTDEMDTYYKEFLEQVQDQKQEVIDNQEIILTLQDTSLLNVFHEKTNEEIHNELEKEISEMFNGIEGEDASKLYDSLHNQIQYA